MDQLGASMGRYAWKDLDPSFRYNIGFAISHEHIGTLCEIDNIVFVPEIVRQSDFIN